jgi:hypothetical protein
MTNTQDAIAAFLAKGGKIVKHSAGKRVLTEKQIYAAMRDQEPKAKVIETLTYPGAHIVKVLQSLWDKCFWTDTRKTVSNRRAIANYMAMLEGSLDHDKNVWLDKNVSYWQDCAAATMRNIGSLIADCDLIDNDTYRAINATYNTLTSSKMDLI